MREQLVTSSKSSEEDKGIFLPKWQMQWILHLRCTVSAIGCHMLFSSITKITVLVRDDVVGTSLETTCCFWTNIIMRETENWSILALQYHCVLNLLLQNTTGEWRKLAEPSKQDTSTKNMATLRSLPATRQWKRCFKNLFPLYSSLFHMAILVVHKIRSWLS